MALINDTGMRLSEACGLQAFDIHLDGDTHYIDLVEHPWRRLSKMGHHPRHRNDHQQPPRYAVDHRELRLDCYGDAGNCGTSCRKYGLQMFNLPHVLGLIGPVSAVALGPWSRVQARLQVRF